MLRAAVVSLTLAAAAEAAQTLYKLDAGWPAGLAGLNVTEVTAVAFQAGAGLVHVAQRGTAEPFVLVFDAATGALARTWGGGDVIASPHGLYYDAGRGAFWVTDIAGATVKLFNATGDLVEVVGTQGVPGGSVNPPQFSAPADVAVDASTGDVLVADGDGGSNSRVLALSGADNAAAVYAVGGPGAGPGQFSSPHSVAAIGGLAIVADRGNARVQFLEAATGAYVDEWNTTACFGGTPWGVRVDAQRGRLLVADGTNGGLYALGFPVNAAAARAVPPCVLLQGIRIPAASKPHELDIDAATGDVYLSLVGTPTTVQRWACVA